MTMGEVGPQRDKNSVSPHYFECEQSKGKRSQSIDSITSVQNIYKAKKTFHQRIL
jgi:hypothetical protein